MTTIDPWRLALEAAADVFDPPAGLWTPYPKQALATRLALQADETLFGGAAGPGKTEWLMRHAIAQMEEHPGNRGGLFRRVFPSLNRTIIPRLKAILHGRAQWNENKHEFVFPNGSVLECASLQYLDTVLDHQGAEYGFIGFEEITEFAQSQWEYMLNRLRAPQEGIRPHAVATTNPGGRGHSWVKRRWVRPKPEDLEDGQPMPQPGEIWRSVAIPGRHTPDNPPLARVFVPATHADNPALLIRDPGYLSRIRAISDRGLRLAMEQGDWDAIDAVEGALWSASLIDQGRISPAQWTRTVRSYQRVLAVDPSDGQEGGDEFGVALCSRGSDGTGYVEGSWSWAASPKRMAEQAVALYHEHGCSALVIERNHGGRWMMEVFRQVDPYINAVDVWASDGKRTRAEPVAALFDPGDALPAQFRARIVGFLPELEEELTSTTFGPGEISPNRLDAMVWGLSWLMLGKRQAKAGTYDDARLRGRR